MFTGARTLRTPTPPDLVRRTDDSEGSAPVSLRLSSAQWLVNCKHATSYSETGAEL